MFSNPFTCPLMGPLERGQAELAALPRGQWEEAPALRSRQLPGFGSEQRACDGIWIWQVPHCLLPQQPLRVVTVLCRSCWLSDAWGQFAMTWQGPRAGTWAGTCVTAVALGRQGQCYAVCVYTPAQGAPQPPMALKGEALMSLMHLVSLSEMYSLPGNRVVCGEEGPGRVAFCSVSVMGRPLTTCAGPVAVQEHSPRLLPELWPSYPC